MSQIPFYVCVYIDIQLYVCVYMYVCVSVYVLVTEEYYQVDY